MGLARGINDAASERRAALEERARELQREKKRLAQDTRNEEKRRARLMERARALPKESLLEILGQRAAAEAKAKAKAKSKGSAKGTAKASATEEARDCTESVHVEMARTESGGEE